MSDFTQMANIAKQVLDAYWTPTIIPLTSQPTAGSLSKRAEAKNLSGKTLKALGVTFCASNTGSIEVDLRVNGVSILTDAVSVDSAFIAFEGAFATTHIPSKATIELWASCSTTINALNAILWCKG